jgi:hypothetical protein
MASGLPVGVDLTRAKDPGQGTSWLLLGLLATALITTVAGFLIAVDDLGRRQEWRSLRAVGLARRGLTAVHLLEATVVGGTAMVIAAVAGAAVGAAFLRVGDEPYAPRSTCSARRVFAYGGPAIPTQLSPSGSGDVVAKLARFDMATDS